MFFDTHCHLTSRRVQALGAAAARRAREARVSRVLCVAIELDDAAEIAKLCAEPGDWAGFDLWASAGVHPQAALQWNDQSEERIRELAASTRCVAIGEMGLDFHYDEFNRERPGAARAVQEEVFERQLNLAFELGKPVIIHNRDADERMLSIFERLRGRLPAGVIHCYSSGPEMAPNFLEFGWYLGFTGIATYKNAPEVREAARVCPLNRILIETDAPYLTPVPHRGKPNEPSYVPLVAAALAPIKGKTFEEMGEIAAENGRRLFGLAG